MNYNKYFQYIQLILISLLLFNFAYAGIADLIDKDSKYENLDYINLFEIPLDMMTITTNAGELFRLNLAFDKDFETRWISSGSYGKEYNDLKTKTKYSSLIPNITITFNKKVLLNSIIYKAYSDSNCEGGIGYPTRLKIYFKNRDSNGDLSFDDNDFIFFEEIKSQPTGNKVLFSFDKIISCDQIKIEWAQVNICKYNNF